MKNLYLFPRIRADKSGVKVLLLCLLSLILLLSCKKEKGEARGRVLVGHIIEKGSNYPVSGARVLLIGSKKTKHGTYADYVVSETEANAKGEYIIDFPDLHPTYRVVGISADHYEKGWVEQQDDEVKSTDRFFDLYLTRRTRTIFRVKNETGGNHNVTIDTPRDVRAGLHGSGLDSTFQLLMNAYDSNEVIISEYKPGNTKINKFKVWVGYNNLQDTIIYTY